MTRLSVIARPPTANEVIGRGSWAVDVRVDADADGGCSAPPFSTSIGCVACELRGVLHQTVLTSALPVLVLRLRAGIESAAAAAVRLFAAAAVVASTYESSLRSRCGAATTGLPPPDGFWSLDVAVSDVLTGGCGCDRSVRPASRVCTGQLDKYCSVWCWWRRCNVVVGGRSGLMVSTRHMFITQMCHAHLRIACAHTKPSTHTRTHGCHRLSSKPVDSATLAHVCRANNCT